MNYKLALFYLLFCKLAFSQPDSVRFYTLEELKGSNPDTVYAISLKKMKLTALPKELFLFKNLKYLNLERNEIADVLPIGEFKHLIYLNLGKNKLQNFPVSVCQLLELEDLVVNRNEFSYVPPCISACTNLRRIDFWETPVRELPKEMSAIKTLELIDFSGVKMNPTGHKALINQFPGVKLELDTPCDCMY